MRLVILFLVFTVASGCNRAQGQWAAPELVFSNEGMEETGNYINQAIALHNGTVHIVTDRFVSDEQGNTVANLFYRARLDGAWTDVINLSNTNLIATRPSLVTDDSGTVHVFWGEQPSTGSAFTDLFYTNKKDEVRLPPWSLFSSDISSGNLSKVPRNSVVDAQGAVHIAFEGPFTVHHMKKHETADLWFSPEEVTSGITPHLAVDEAGRLLLTFLDAFPGEQQRDVNSVLFTVSSDAGASWGPRVLVNKSGMQPAFRPQVVPTTQGDLHVIWMKSLNEDILSERIWHAVSEDGGETWSSPHEISPPPGGNIFSFDAVADASGRIHLVFDQRTTFSDPDSRIFYTLWEESAWIQPAEVFPLRKARFKPKLALGDEQELHLLWNEFDGTISEVYLAGGHVVTSAEEDPVPAPSFLLDPNYPNPFRAVSTITYSLPRPGQVSFRVYTLTGRVVRSEELGWQPVGSHRLTFEADGLAAGTYFYEVAVNERRQVRPMTLIR